MTTHQQKKLDAEQLIAFRDRFALPLTDAQVRRVRVRAPAAEAPEMAYLHARREKLGGYLPARNADGRAARDARRPNAFAKFALEAGGKEMSTTVALRAHGGRAAARTRCSASASCRSSPTRRAPSAWRTSSARSASTRPSASSTSPRTATQLSYYKEAVDGQILEEGINEAGAIASWVAAATSYSAHGIAMLPMYIYYSMFGFQRVGDEIWAAADSRSRGFLLGATAGRTTLSGEGLQHQDGTSHLVASTVPNCRAYDPCFAYELAVILEDGMRAHARASRRTSSTT